MGEVSTRKTDNLTTSEYESKKESTESRLKGPLTPPGGTEHEQSAPIQKGRHRCEWHGARRLYCTSKACFYFSLPLSVLHSSSPLLTSKNPACYPHFLRGLEPSEGARNTPTSKGKASNTDVVAAKNGACARASRERKRNRETCGEKEELGAKVPFWCLPLGCLLCVSTPAYATRKLGLCRGSKPFLFCCACILLFSG